MKSEAFVAGQRAELQFASIAKSKGWHVRSATRHQNIFNHIDFFISANANTYSVDVKAQKKESRNLHQQDEWHVIEFVGVVHPATTIVNFSENTFDPLNPNFSLGSGRHGWIYGDATMIAFEMSDEFVIVNRKRLLRHCANLINFSRRVLVSQYAKYCVYSRKDRGDLVSYIHKNDLYNICYLQWKKPTSL